MRRAGMILEGGGTRGVFTAGVLDYFMEQGLYLPYVIGVSAGACNAVNYVSHQKGIILLGKISKIKSILKRL